jgi:ribosomal protein L11 methyltransferase
MDLPENPHHSNHQKDGCPYQDLYIYYLEGTLQPGKAVFQDNFIGNWEEDNFSFLFFSSPARREVEDLVRSQPQLTIVDSFQMSYDQWQNEGFTSQHHGQFQILPAWEAQAPEARAREPRSDQNTQSDKKTILLDPGVVFGNGTHPTTGDCLEALELAFGPAPPEKILDLGTGTGVLAIAAAYLGAKIILAVDLNPLAVETAQKNVHLNEFADLILVARSRAQDCIDFQADLVIANIHWEVMRELVFSEGFLQKKQYILSGLLRSEARDLTEILAKLPVVVQKMWTQDGIWHTFYGGTGDIAKQDNSC